MIPYGRQDINDDDVASVIKVLHSDYLTQGQAVDEFESALSKYVGSKFSVVVSSATAALHLVYKALGMGPGKSVWTAPNTFVATANAALYCGASIDFVDIDPKSYTLSIDLLEEKLISTQRSGGKMPDLVVMVHFAGQTCNMRELKVLANKYDFKIVEDASHAIGAVADGQRVGSCQFSDACVFSFHPVKIITTGEGGAITTQCRDLSRKIMQLRSHGITRDQKDMVGESEGGWYYQQIDLGFNYRLTDIQAALGLSQLNRIDSFVSNRRRLAARYDKHLESFPLERPWQNPECHSAFHLYPIKLNLKAVLKGRKAVYDAMRSSGIGVNVHYIPVHLQPYYQRLGFRKGDFPNAESYYDAALTIPLFSSMSHDQQNQVVDVLSKIILGD